ncbi:MAG: S-adenosylmethionine decarboxylase [Candidatus Aenigmarchaeota archaeon]|nr:S-adenosylmethionine decarboxylase [Candidatus Aenigmarchaeota archaeon]
MMEKPTRALMKTHHIVFDAIGCDTRLNDEQFVFTMLMEIPKLVGMKIMTGPHIARDHNPDNEGISGFAIISFSHISIHTFPKTKEIYVDVFSCRPFDYAKVRAYLHEKLNVPQENVETHEVKYPWEE